LRVCESSLAVVEPTVEELPVRECALPERESYEGPSRDRDMMERPAEERSSSIVDGGFGLADGLGDTAYVSRWETLSILKTSS
jgi:hypothetical protein